MATITLDYNARNVQAQKALEYILSLGLFKPSAIGKKESISEKREKLDIELKDYLVDLSNFKFNREDANRYD
jgi:phosphotransacetylase